MIAGGSTMDRYTGFIMALDFSVQVLLLRGAGDKCGVSLPLPRVLAAAGVGAIFTGACLHPSFRFLGRSMLRALCLIGVAGIAFGVGRSALRPSMVFLFFHLLVSGLAAGLTGAHAWFGMIALSAGCIVYLLLLHEGEKAQYLPICIRHGGKTVSLTALLDTGNLLCDPVSGESVLIVSAQVGMQLLNLTAQQLADPIATMTTQSIPGLRLIPYRTVGQGNGMLLAKRFACVRVGEQSGARIVAFSPHAIGGERSFQALAGGKMA